MKKYVFFFASIFIIVGIVFVYSTVSVQKSKQIVFTEDGYVLNSANTKYNFNQDDTYTKTYDKQITFLDTKGTKITVGEDNFLHYSSGNIVALQESVLLDLSRINENPIVYYNVSANKEIKKMSNRYVVKNLATDLQFDEAIWKVSQNKYIILGDDLKVYLNDGTSEALEDYVQIEYSDNEIVNIYNQKFKSQTISSDSYIEIGNGIKLNLGDKIVSVNDENKMSLENMVINSDDNITLIDINDDKYKKENKSEEQENTEANENKTEEEKNENEKKNIQTVIEETNTSTETTTSIQKTQSSDQQAESVRRDTTKENVKNETKNINIISENTTNTTNNTTINNTTNTTDNTTTNNTTTNTTDNATTNNTTTNTTDNATTNNTTTNTTDNTTTNNIATNTTDNTTINNTTTNTTDNTTTNNTTTNTTNSTTTNNTTTNTTDNTTTNNTTTNTTNQTKKNPIIIDTPEILYEYYGEGESKVDTSITLDEPKFKLENMNLSSVGISGDIQITDEDDLLSKEKDIVVKVINNKTGKTAAEIKEAYGTFNIPLRVETLVPDTTYSLIVSAFYTVNDVEYSKNFLYKVFETKPVGYEIEKEYFTDSSLNFKIKFTDNLIENVTVYLLDSKGTEIANRNQFIRNVTGEASITFESLKSNTEYIVRVSKVTYDGITQEGENWNKDISAKTLKNTPAIENINYSINKRDGTFKLYIEDVKDENKSIENYQFLVYQFKEIEDEDGNIVLGYDTKEPVYKRETTAKEITIKVGEKDSDEPIIREKYYGFKVIANSYDNEKYVEYESTICGAFALNGNNFPTIKFERIESEYPPTEIQGNLYIIDNDETLTVDSDNPLTITYYSDVDETKIYKKIKVLDSEQKYVDKDGNKVIKIAVDLGGEGSSSKGLKEETSYTFSVYGTVDLKDGNGEYKNSYIGSSIVSTTTYKDLEVKLSKGDISSNTFTIEMNLEGDEVAREGISSLNIMLYEGSGDINSGEYRNWSRTITKNNFASCKENAKYDKEINSLQDLLFDNTLLINPSFIGGNNESNYTELNYQVIVTATVDGTNYENKIPLKAKEDDDDDTGNTTYINKNTGESYTAAYIIAKGKGTTASMTQEQKAIRATAIKNIDAAEYGLVKNDNLNDNTYIGYKVSTDFVNTGSLIAKEITYFVWDENGEPIEDGRGNQLKQTLKITNQERAPSAVFTLGNGTNLSKDEDNKTGLHRGGAYFFSYIVTYIDANDQDLIWPDSISNDDEIFTNKTLRTDTVYPNKQEPSFVIYPITSNENSITYIYSCIDYDKALQEEANLLCLKVLNQTSSRVSEVKIIADGIQHEAKFVNLTNFGDYKIEYKRNLNKVSSAEYTSQTLTKQYFEGILNCDDTSIKRVERNETEDPNNLKIFIDGRNVQRISALRVKFKKSDKTIITKLLKMENEYDEYYVKVDLLDLIENYGFTEFMGIDAGLDLMIYYDTGIIGYQSGEIENNYAIFTNNDNSYMILDNTNKFVTTNKISGNMFYYIFTPEDDKALLSLATIEKMNNGEPGATIELMYSDSGMKNNNEIIVPKKVASKEIETDKIVNIKNLRLGIKISEIKSTLAQAKVKAVISNPMGIDIEKIELELWHSKNEDDIPNWEDAQKIQINIEDVNQIQLDSLSPAEFYYFRFNYTDGGEKLYLYDTDTKETGKVYRFETVATIGINNLEVVYQADNYINKYINISYKINKDRANMYENVKYTFYKIKDDSKVILNNENIIVTDSSNNYSIVNDSLVITNSRYLTSESFENVLEKINITPDENVFEFGEEYRLEITPTIVISQGEEIELETIEKTFTLNKLNDAAIGLKMTRRQKNDENNSQYIRVAVSIHDTDGIIYGQTWGEYKLYVYKYKEDVNQATEIEYYSSLNSERSLKGTTFNLQTNAKNYLLYIKPEDVDYEYNYIAKIVMEYDELNKGQEYTSEHTEQYKLNAISNSEGVSIGSALLEAKENSLEVRFYDSYNDIEKINRVDYFVFEISNNYNQSGSFKPEWVLVGDSIDDVAYYKMSLPIEFSENEVYTIKLNFYVGNVLVGQVDTSYIKE